MHYYQLNIGDYAKHTRHLTLLEDLAYRRLLDHYYMTEKPIMLDIKKLSRLVGMPKNQEEITNVLSDFFTESNEGYFQNRVDEEITKYRLKADSARANGAKGGRPRKANKNPDETELKPKITQPVNLANPDETGSKANQEPRTTNQEPLTNKPIKRFVVPTIDEINIYLIEKGVNDYSYAEKIWHFYESKGWIVGKSKMKKWKSAISANWINSYQQQIFIPNDRQEKKDEVRRKLMNPRDTNW